MDEQQFKWLVISLSAANLEVTQQNFKVNTATYHATLEKIEQEKRLLSAVQKLLERIEDNGKMF